MFSRKTPDLARVALTNDTMRRLSKDISTRPPSVVLDRGVISTRVQGDTSIRVAKVQNPSLRRLSKDVMRRLSKDISTRPPSIAIEPGVISKRVVGENELVSSSTSSAVVKQEEDSPRLSTSPIRLPSVALDRGLVSNRTDRVSGYVVVFECVRKKFNCVTGNEYSIIIHRYEVDTPSSPTDPPGLGYSNKNNNCVETRRLIDFVEQVLEDETKHRLSIVSVASAKEISVTAQKVRERFDSKRVSFSSPTTQSDLKSEWGSSLMHDPDPLYLLGEIVERRREMERAMSVVSTTMDENIIIPEEEVEVLERERKVQEAVAYWTSMDMEPTYEYVDVVPTLLAPTSTTTTTLKDKLVKRSSLEKRRYGSMNDDEYATLLANELAICAAHAAADYARAKLLQTRDRILSLLRAKHEHPARTRTKESKLLPAVVTRRRRRQVPKHGRRPFHAMYPPTKSLSESIRRVSPSKPYVVFENYLSSNITKTLTPTLETQILQHRLVLSRLSLESIRSVPGQTFGEMDSERAFSFVY